MTCAEHVWVGCGARDFMAGCGKPLGRDAAEAVAVAVWALGCVQARGGGYGDGDSPYGDLSGSKCVERIWV